MRKDLRIVFFGTPDFAVASLKAMMEEGFEVAAVVTAPDKPAGRGQKLRMSAVKEFALEAELPVLQPTNLKSEDFLHSLKAFEANLQVVVAFRMLPEAVWDMPELGTYNVHGSLLPDYRGAAPINWAIVNGEKETGVTTFKLKHEIDTGSILLQKKTAIGPEETAGELYVRLMHLGAEALTESLHLIASDKAELSPQPDHAGKHAPKIQKQDAEIQWTQPAQRVHDFVRGMNPFPGAFATVWIHGAQENWKIHRTSITEIKSDAPGTVKVLDGQILIGTEDFYVSVQSIQPAGKRKMSSKDFLNGYQELLQDVRFKA